MLLVRLDNLLLVEVSFTFSSFLRNKELSLNQPPVITFFPAWPFRVHAFVVATPENKKKLVTPQFSHAKKKMGTHLLTLDNLSVQLLPVLLNCVLGVIVDGDGDYVVARRFVRRVMELC